MAAKDDLRDLITFSLALASCRRLQELDSQLFPVGNRPRERTGDAPCEGAGKETELHRGAGGLHQ